MKNNYFRLSRELAPYSWNGVEGDPSQGKFSISDCGGVTEMYVNQGFDILEIPGGIIARKQIWSFVNF